MTALVFIGRYAIKPGKLDDLYQHLAEHVSYVRENNEHMLAFEFFVDPEAHEVTVVQVHPHGASLALHMRLGWESGHFARATELLDAGSWDLYGDPGAELEAQLTDPSVGVSIRVHHQTKGFDRIGEMAEAR